MPIERFAAGQAFHRAVQSAFLSGLAGGSGFKERHWRLVAGGRGRVDLAVEVDGREQMLVIIEIKGTDWDTIPAARIMRNLRLMPLKIPISWGNVPGRRGRGGSLTLTPCEAVG